MCEKSVVFGSFKYPDGSEAKRNKWPFIGLVASMPPRATEYNVLVLAVGLIATSQMGV
jgi:hypothetical protein